MRVWVLGAVCWFALILCCACERESDPPASGGSGGSGGFGGTAAGGAAGVATGGTSTPTGGASPLRACADAVALGSEPLIDDFEDADNVILTQDGRNGTSLGYDEGNANAVTCSFDEIEGGRADSLRALHTTGSGSSGAGILINLHYASRDAQGKPINCWYDASVYEGVRFWARGNSVPVRFRVRTTDVIPILAGGSCNPKQAVCYDDHGTELTFGEEWQEFTIPFTDLMQTGTAGVAFDPQRIQRIYFSTEQGVSFDYWLDDIGFYPKR